MKASLILSSTLASTAFAARQAFETLSTEQVTSLEQQLAKWKALYGPIAEANGFLPEINTESADVNGHSAEELERFHNTVQDVEEAAAANPDATFSPMNQFALLSDKEFKGVLMKSFGAQNFTSAAPLPETEIVRASEADWSTSKCNPPMANQGSCGSCWAFSTVGTVEAAHCIATGELVDLSEQQLVSCDKKSYGCNGGFPPSAINWMHEGVCTEASYPYTSGKGGQTGTCDTSCTKKALSIGKAKTTSGENSLMTVLNSQPATVTVESGNAVWRNYKSGVVTQCPGSQSDHAVIAVGYGTSTGDFFKIKNSWGAQWGDNGYMYLKRGVGGKGMCNVVEGISYPELGGSPVPTSNQPTPTRKPLPTAPTTAAPGPTRKPLPVAPTTTAPGPTRKPLPVAPTTTAPGPTRKPLPVAPTTTAPGPTRKPLPVAPTTTAPGPTRKPLPVAPTTTAPGPTRKPLPTAPTTDVPQPITPTTTKPRCTKKPKTKKPKTTVPYTTDAPSPTSGSPSTTTRRPFPTFPTTTGLTPSTTDPSTTRRPLPTTGGPKPTTQPSPTYAPKPSPPSGNGVKDQLIHQTNLIRAAHGVGPLAWDDALAPKMQEWANSCPGFNHGGPKGWQNLATNTACGTNGKDCMNVVGASWMWYNQEETYWNYESNSCNGDWAKCGHFSNMMSPEVKSMACGWSQCANGNYVWCNYNTPVKNPVVAKISGMTKEQLKASLAA